LSMHCGDNTRSVQNFEVSNGYRFMCELSDGRGVGSKASRNTP